MSLSLSLSVCVSLSQTLSLSLSLSYSFLWKAVLLLIYELPPSCSLHTALHPVTLQELT